MRIPMRVDYGLRALLELTEHHGRGLVPSSQIAERQGVPEPYLDQLMATLRKGGLVRSTRGPHGGHALARPPDEISVSEAVGALEGSASLLECVHEGHGCGYAGLCVQRELWQDVEAAVQRVLKSVTLAEMARRQAAHNRRDVYFI